MDFQPNLQFCNRNYDFALIPEIGISRVLQESPNMDHQNSSYCILYLDYSN